MLSQILQFPIVRWHYTSYSCWNPLLKTHCSLQVSLQSLRLSLSGSRIKYRIATGHASGFGIARIRKLYHQAWELAKGP